MKVRHYDEVTGKWVIDGASNASELELTNPGFLNEAGESISINNGFTKLDNRMTQLEKNLAWIYLNGAKGGSGGGPGGGDGSEYTIDVAEGNTVYTANNTVTLNILIKSGGVKKPFTIIAKDLATNQTLGTWKKYSMSRADITITGLSGTTDIELSAYDNDNVYATPVYIKVIAGAISLEIQSIPPKTMYMGGVAEVALNFTVTNNILQSPAEFWMTINGIEVARVGNITTAIRSLSYDARKLLFESEHFSPKAGQRFYFVAQASTTLNGEVISSEQITFDITVADSNNLVIVTEDITEFTPSDTEGETWEDLTQYGQGSQLGFSYYLSYGLSKYSTFNMDYKIHLMNSGGEVQLLDSGTIRNINKSETNRFVYSTVNLSVNNTGEYLRITLFGYAVNDPGDTSAQYTKTVTCRIVESVSVDLYANNDMHTLLAYFSKITGFPNTSTGTWNYPLKTSGEFIYEGAFASKFPDGVNFTLKGVNGKTSGFLQDSDGVNQIPATVLSGEAYGYLEVADVMFPAIDIDAGVSFFQPQGFHISCTYKAEASSDPNEVICGIGQYENDELKTGYEVTLEKAVCKIGSADTLTVKLPQNELLTVDLDVSLLSGTAWYFKIYINGVLSSVSRVSQSDIDWMFGTDFYFGCRNDNGKRSRFSNVSIYDIKIYTSSQSEYAIVQNYISATEQARLRNGMIDASLDAELRTKNLFDSAGNCLIWDKTLDGSKGGFLSGELLYSKLVEQMEINTPYPIVLVEETSNSPTLFEPYSTAIFSASDKIEVMGTKFPCKITYMDSKGRVVISTPSGVSENNGVTISLQGTSSLSYNAKNFEIYMGDVDQTGKKMLFQPTEDWLPENEFTLKADVVDSAHVNNVVIGQIVNGRATNSAGQSITPFGATPPMSLGNDVWGGDAEKANAIRGKIKHTSEGFPVLLFIRYAPDADGTIKQPKFCGIYNFNLGRYAYFNLGLKLLTDYTKVTQDGPTLVTDYTEDANRWNTGVSNGVYSIEINQNSSAQGAFQQDDMKIVQFMGDVMYTSRDEAIAYNQVQKFYTQMANMALTRIQKYTMDDAGQTPTKPIPGEFYDLDKNAYYNFNACDQHLNWDNACAYFILALLFGCVDSMCKNLTIRSWGTDVWYCCFYDMDTAFGLNNAGQDIVEYWAHLHRWYNVASQDTGITQYTQEKNYVSTDSYKQYFASWWNRIWEVLENLAGQDSGSTENRTSLESLYVNLRTNLFPDPDKFIKDYYQSYTEKTGSIMFNYDYKIKYLAISKTYDPDTGKYEDSTDFSQLKFLHGNRVMHVRDWFRKRVMFLDGVYGYKDNTNLLPTTIESPITGLWANNKATGSNTEVRFGTDITANSQILYHYSHDKTTGAFWISETPTSVVLPMPTGETVIYMYANKYITDFTKFKSYPWTGLDNINLPLLQELDLSGLTNVDAAYFFQGGVYNEINDVGLKNIKKLNLSRVKLIGSTASAYTLDLSGCRKIQELDISYSSITKVTLPDSAVLKKYNLSGTEITSLVLTNQSFLEDLVIDECMKLTSIEINNCAALKTLNIPSNVQTVVIRNCESMEVISIPYISIDNSVSSLRQVTIDNCPGLKTFNVSGQNNESLKLELTGAWNLEELNISNTKTQDIILPSLYVNGEPNFKSLKSLNISGTSLSTLKYNDRTFDYLDLTAFPDLENISALGCRSLVEVRCRNDKDNPIELSGSAFKECTSLVRVKGHLALLGNEVFRNCSSFYLNSNEVYTQYGTDVFLTGDNVTNITFDSKLEDTYCMFESCSSLSYNDFKYLMVRLTPNLTSLEGMFKGCTNISGDIWYDIFRPCPNVVTIKEAFSTTRLSGPFFSRTSDYSTSNDSTWGVLDFLPKLTDAEAAFEDTSLEWIDDNVFAPVGGKYSPIVKADYMFRGCQLLKSCENTRATVPTAGLLTSKTFFTNLRNLASTYPRGIFSGCTGIRMAVSNDSSGNTYLFHSINRVAQSMILTDYVYTGITLVGKIGPNVFGGVSQTINDGATTWYIPTFTSIQYPFQYSGGELTVNLSEMANMFQGISGTLRQAVGIFSGVKCAEEAGAQSIPATIFKNCTILNSIEGFFNGIDLDNDGKVYQFPPAGMFDDCVSLTNIKSLFSGCHNLKLKLVGEGFKNCSLQDVSYAFEDSGVFGVIPYRLFFMSKNNADGTKSISRTINNMEGVFKGCWCLGYDNTRTIDVGSELELNSTYTTWEDHIIKNIGNRVTFKLDVSNMKKSYNYDRNEDADSEDYNPGEQAFDVWYLDGYGWEGASSSEPGLSEVKARLQEKYFKYDEQQKVALSQLDTGRAQMGYQNYMIPTDYFRYCSPNCTLSGATKDFCYREQVKVFVPETGSWKLETTDNWDGMVGRIPCKLFESLVDNKVLNSVFEETRFCAFVNLQGDTFTRGIKYPPDLFKYNTALEDITGMFALTEIEVGVDVNSNLFEHNPNLKIISEVWMNCRFDKRAYNAGGTSETYSQFDFVNIFKNNTKITNASNLFAVTGLTNETKPYGLLIITSDLLKTCYNINNISNMFYYCINLQGSVPTFSSASYPILNVVSGYLSGVQKENITNADQLESRLVPSEWQ